MVPMLSNPKHCQMINKTSGFKTTFTGNIELPAIPFRCSTVTHVLAVNTAYFLLQITMPDNSVPLSERSTFASFIKVGFDLLMNANEITEIG